MNLLACTYFIVGISGLLLRIDQRKPKRMRRSAAANLMILLLRNIKKLQQLLMPWPSKSLFGIHQRRQKRLVTKMSIKVKRREMRKKTKRYDGKTAVYLPTQCDRWCNRLGLEWKIVKILWKGFTTNPEGLLFWKKKIHSISRGHTSGTLGGGGG